MEGNRAIKIETLWLILVVNYFQDFGYRSKRLALISRLLLYCN